METNSIISIILAISVFLMILIVGVTTNILKETIGNEKQNQDEYPYSFSKFQLWVWTLILIPLFVLHWGFVGNAILNPTVLVLLGISTGSLSTATIVQVAKAGSKNRNQLKSEIPGGSQGFWKDILSDDKGKFSLVRLQNFLFTLTYVIIFVISFFEDNMDYPDFDTTSFTLMGISTGGFVAGKGMSI